MEQEDALNEQEEQEEQEEPVLPEPAEASLDELLAKKGDEGGAGEEPDTEEDAILTTTPSERVEPLAVKVVPQQPTEFVCKKCFLVKHRSQLADKKRMYCRDCA